MTRVLVLTLSLVTLIGIPLPVFAQTNGAVFEFPEGVAGGSYQANIETVLRDTYQLKLESDARASVFRWSFAGGEMPPGLVVRPSGTIIGTPRVARPEPYRFQVKVVDLAYKGSDPLQLDVRLAIVQYRLRLTQVRTPRLTALRGGANTADRETSRVQSNHATESSGSQADRLSDVQSSFVGPANGPAHSSPVARNEFASSGSFNRTAAAESSDSRKPEVDTSYVANLIRPMLRTMKPNPYLPIPALPLLPKLSSKKVYEVDVAKELTRDDKIRGPAKIKLKNLNVLRNDNRVGKEVSFPAAPNLTLPFIPPIPGQPGKQTPGGQGAVAAFVVNPPSCPTVNDCFSDFVDRLNAIERNKTTNVNSRINSISQTVNFAAVNLQALVSASDSILNAGGGAQAILSELITLIGTAAAPGGSVDAALAADVVWPDDDIQNLLGDLNVLENDVLSLPTVPITSGPSFHVWYNANTNKAAYDGLRARIDELQAQLNGLGSSSPQGVAFQTVQSRLRLWKPILISVRDGGLAGFDRDFEVDCGFAFNTGKVTEVKLVKRDRLADAGANPTEQEIVTVECSSPLSISAGFGFSNVDEREFVFVQSTKPVTTGGQTTQTVINRFGFRNRSGFRTLPVILLNTRVWEPNDTLSVHISTGAAVDIKTGQGGTDLEYIVGPSISFWRSLFITPGLHMGRVNKLAGGFELDQEVPTGVNEPPIEKSWKKGFVTTLTYKIK